MEVSSYLSGSSLLIYYSIVIAGAFFTLFRFGINKISVLMILVFWQGFFSFLGNNTSLNYNYYQIFLFFYCFLLFGQKVFIQTNRFDNYINIAFLLLSVEFWISYLNTDQEFLTSASQYCLKYAFPFLFYHGIKTEIQLYTIRSTYIIELLLFIILLQVIFSVIKLFVVGSIVESVVGSIQFLGGGTAVILPELAFILFYLYKKENLTRQEWLKIFSLLLISFVSGKRSPVIIFPIMVLLILIYVKKSVKLVALLKYSPFILIIFYLGVKTNPSLNSEGSSWGSFNLKFLFNKAVSYNFGTEDIGKINSTNTSGRGGSLYLIFSPNSLEFNNLNDAMFGHGIVSVVTGNKGRFVAGEESNYGINHEGLMGAAVAKLYSLGYLGLFTYLIFAYYIIRIIENKNMRLIIMGFFLWDFFLYGDIVIGNNPVAVIFIVVCIYSNSIIPKDIKLS
jgi:hypothetical protein